MNLPTPTGLAWAVLARDCFDKLTLTGVLLALCFGGSAAGAERPQASLGFLSPGETRLAEAVQELGEPDLDYTGYVVEGDIDPFGGPKSPDGLRMLYRWARAADREVTEVRVLEWSLAKWPNRVTLVFDHEILWYAVIFDGDDEPLRERLAERYRGPAGVETRWRQVADMISTLRLTHYPKGGVSFMRGGISGRPGRILYPPGEQVPSIGLACCPARIDNEYLGIRPGSTAQEVLAALGPPHRTADPVAVGRVGGLKLLEYPDRRVSVFVQDGKVALITLVPREGGGFPLQIGQWNEDRNPKLGHMKEKLPSVHGRDAYLQDVVVHLYPGAGIAAHADSKGRVQVIELFAPTDVDGYRRTYYRQPRSDLH